MMMEHFTLYISLIADITISTLYVPFFILLNQQDSSYGKIYDSVSMQGMLAT